MRITKQNKKKKLLVIILLVLLLVAISAAATLLFTPLGNWLRGSTVQTDTSKNSNTNTVDYSGPSESDIDESQNAKKNNDSTSGSNTSDSSGSSNTKTKVSVGISYADVYNGNLEIRAFTNGVIEDTGICTATVTNGSSTVTQTSTAFVDVSTTQCNPLYIATSRLSAGKWQVTVTFSSPDTEGSSDTTEVTI